MTVQREKMDYDVVIVGAGPAGLSAAIRLKQLDPERSVAAIHQALEDGGARILSRRDPAVLPKAIKNAVEVAGHKAAQARDGRMLTLVPWRGRALVGTSQSATTGGADDVSVTAAEIETFIADANTAFPALKLSPADVTLVHRGIVPAATANGKTDLKPSAEIIDHANGAVTVVGVKFTTARAVAERAIGAEVAILEPSRRRDREFVGPAVERVQCRQRRLQRMAAIAAQAFPARAPGDAGVGERGFDQPIAVREGQRVVGVVALFGGFKRA